MRIYPNRRRLYARCHQVRSIRIRRPYAAAESMFRGVDARDRIGEFGVAQHRHDRPELLVADQARAARDRKSTRRTPVTNAHLVCRLLLAKKKKNQQTQTQYPKYTHTTIQHTNL